MVEGTFQILNPTSLKARVVLTMTIQEWMEINDTLKKATLSGTPYRVRMVLEQLFDRVKDTVFYADEDDDEKKTEPPR